MASHHAKHPPSRPVSGVMRRCVVEKPYDGDTVTVKIITSVRIRMIGCWAPEVRGTSGVEKEKALASRDHLIELAEGATGEVFIPLDDVDRLDDTLSMGRVLGVIYLDGDDLSLSERQVMAGHASTTKGGALGE